MGTVYMLCSHPALHPAPPAPGSDPASLAPPTLFDPDTQADKSPATAVTRSAKRRARKRLCGLHRLRQLRKPWALALRGGRLAAALAAERLERGARPRARVQRLADRRGYTRVHECAALACKSARPPRSA